MKRSHIALAALVLCACSSRRSMDGPLVDWSEHAHEVEALIGGQHEGVVAEGSYEGEPNREPCAVVGQAFLLPIEVGDPVGCGDHEGHQEDSGSDCSSSDSASFPLSGSLSLDGVLIGEVTGSAHGWSTDSGVYFEVSLVPPPGDYPRQNLHTQPNDLDDGTSVLSGFLWERRLTDEGVESVWEICLMPLS